jgi:hypothetical protein
MDSVDFLAQSAASNSPLINWQVPIIPKTSQATVNNPYATPDTSAKFRLGLYGSEGGDVEYVSRYLPVE